MSSLHDNKTYTYPFISPTYTSHQLWSPYYLNRLTINDPNYHSYLSHSITNNPSHLNALARRVQRYGDNGFFLHKDIPKEQLYVRTSLKRSEVRPWDQIVSRPILTPLIIDKESQLPFPSEHPYTSHISQHALFPSTTRPKNEILLREPTPLIFNKQQEQNGQQKEQCTNDIGTQTEQYTEEEEGEEQALSNSITRAMTPQEGRPRSFYVTDKAFSKGLRYETSASSVAMVTGTDVPCSEDSFLATSLRPGIYRWDISKTKPLIHQHSMTYPSPTTIYSPNKHTLTYKPLPLTQYTRQALNTVNNTHITDTTYKRHYTPPNIQQHCSTVSTTLTSRGKYARTPSFNYRYNEIPPHITEGSKRVSFNGDTVIIMCDKYTQTIQEEKHLLYRPSSEHDSYLRPSTVHSITSSSNSVHSKDSIPATVYNKSDAIKKYHLMYPDNVPDLRVHCNSSQRRHVINGYHSYYWH